MFRECLFTTGALEDGLRLVWFGRLGDGVRLARPAADRESFEDIVVDLARSSAVGVLAELPT